MKHKEGQEERTGRLGILEEAGASKRCRGHLFVLPEVTVRDRWRDKSSEVKRVHSVREREGLEGTRKEQDIYYPGT